MNILDALVSIGVIAQWSAVDSTYVNGHRSDRGCVLPTERLPPRRYTLRQNRCQLPVSRYTRCNRCSLVLMANALVTVTENRVSTMQVKRIIPSIEARDPGTARAFYSDILGLQVVMDLCWIVTFAAETTSGPPQISIASEGGSGTPVPLISIEVDDLD